MDIFTSHFHQLDFIIKKKNPLCPSGVKMAPSLAQAALRGEDKQSPEPVTTLRQCPPRGPAHCSVNSVSPVVSNTPHQSSPSQVFCFPSDA